MQPVTFWRSIIQLFWAGLLLLVFAACASKSPREIMEEKQAGARPSRHTVWTDRFYMNQPHPPPRKAGSWEFFYKDCELARRSERPTRSEWDCKDP